MASAEPQTARTSSPEYIYRFGHFELDTRSGELRKNGYRVRMQDQPRCILLLLIEHAGDIVPRQQFHHALWPEDTFVDFDLGLNAAVRKLRIALGERVKHPQLIETISRRGYRFAAPVARFEIDPSQPPSQLFPAEAWLNAIQTTQSQTPQP